VILNCYELQIYIVALRVLCLTENTSVTILMVSEGKQHEKMKYFRLDMNEKFT
jgi:hypothetical protein